MSYIGVIEGQPSKLRNSLSIRELFARDQDYYRVFNLAGGSTEDDVEETAKAIGSGFVADVTARTRALQIFTAWALREACKNRIAAAKDKNVKGALRKGTYFISWLIFNAEPGSLRDEIDRQAEHAPSPGSIGALLKEVGKLVERHFSSASKHFGNKRQQFVEKNGGNEDSALKNTAFAKSLANSWPAAIGGRELFDAADSDSTP